MPMFLDLQHPIQRDSLKFNFFYNLQIITEYLFIYVSIIALRITVHNMSVFMNYNPNEVLYVLISALFKFLYKVLQSLIFTIENRGMLLQV